MRQALRVLAEPLPVLLDPALRFRRKRAAALPSWSLPRFDDSRVLLTFSGTTALYQAAVALGMNTGNRVLLPAYNCGHEVEPFVRAGARLDFYRVRATLDIDVEHLIAQITRDTRAILVTHYFGFPQPLEQVRAVCDQRGIALIEDCAHALFGCDGDKPIGMTGHLSVYSLRKSLPLPHGGALVGHDARYPMPENLAEPPALSTIVKRIERYQKGWLMPDAGPVGTARRAAFLASRAVANAAGVARAVARMLGSTQFDPDSEAFGFPDEVLRWGMARSVRETLFNDDRDLIVGRRRRNFELLLAQAENFRNCRPVLPVLPAGVCPLYFPVFSEDPARCVRELRRGAVSSVIWWGATHDAVPWTQFPEVAQLKRNIVALPIHQDLRDDHMMRIAELLS